MTKNKITTFTAAVCLASIVMLVYVGNTSASRSHSRKPQQEASSNLQKVPNGQELKVTGIVIKRNADSFIHRDLTGVEREVALTPQTKVQTYKKGVFRGGKEYGVSYILRGLRLQVKGTGNSAGQLVADRIEFEETDLKTAQAFEARLDPVEELAEANRKLAEANRARIEAEEAESKRLAQASEENAAAAARAQTTADEALKSALLANDRINGLSDYDPVKTITVRFATGSAVLGPKGKATIDEAAAWVKTQNTKGWIVAVLGFADTTGNTAANAKLSERRANAVIAYLVQKHNLPLQRLVQPFGYGENNPVAENATAQGRSLNRRVEIRLLANKGIANTGEK